MVVYRLIGVVFRSRFLRPHGLGLSKKYGALCEDSDSPGDGKFHILPFGYHFFGLRWTRERHQFPLVRKRRYRTPSPARSSLVECGPAIPGRHLSDLSSFRRPTGAGSTAVSRDDDGDISIRTSDFTELWLVGSSATEAGVGWCPLLRELGCCGWNVTGVSIC